MKIATQDARAFDKLQSEFILQGWDDSIQLQQLSDQLLNYESMEIIGGNVNLGTTGFSIGGHFRNSLICPQINFSGTYEAIRIFGNKELGMIDIGQIYAPGAGTGIKLAGLINGEVKSTIYG